MHKATRNLVKLNRRTFSCKSNIFFIANGLKKPFTLCVFARDSHQRSMSRFSAGSILPACDTFSLGEYDCIGFDLDNTICHYNISNLVRLEYDILSRFLISQKGYDSKFLSKPIDLDLDFIQKGLILGCKSGNILRVGADGFIHAAYHGTHRKLTDSDICKYYGSERQWDIAKEFSKDMLIAWNGPLALEIRTILDYFDLPASLCFARCVDTIDNKKGCPFPIYDSIWPDILDGLIYMFSREHFALNIGEFFPKLKSDPSKYYRKCSKDVLTWIKNMRAENKLTFLITGSNVDYANLTAEYCIGENWHDLFDLIIYYARKPGFFTGVRPFLNVNGEHESDEVEAKDLKLCSGYSQGNWKGVLELFKKETNKTNPKVIYFGDNIIQDIYTPTAHGISDAIAIVEEMSAEGMFGSESNHPDANFITSKKWGSLFYIEDQENYVPSMWDSVIRRHARLCIPSLDSIAKLPIDHRFKAFNNKDLTLTGYYPAAPSGVNK